jgi:hypothetical protein
MNKKAYPSIFKRSGALFGKRLINPVSSAPLFWLLAPEFWLLAPGSWLLTPDSWLLAPGFWLLAPGS